MAGLRRLARPPAPPDTLADLSMSGLPADSAIRPRIGRRPRKPEARRAAFSSLLLRNLALASAVIILGGGTWVGVHLAGMREQAAQDKPDPNRMAVKAALALRPSPPQSQPQPQIQNAVQESRQDTLQDKPQGEAGAEPRGEPQGEPQRELQAQPQAQADAQAQPQGQASAAVPHAPTAADFARPAFLEPIPPQAAAQRQDASAAPPADGTDPVEVASIRAPEESAVAPLPAKRPDDVPAPAKDDADKERTALITMDINLRSGPRRSSRVIGTIPAGTRVTLVGCKSWCEVVAKGKHGYVYRRAVKR